MKLKNPIYKGLYFYEIQILMFIIMYQWNPAYKQVSNWWLIKIGNFYIQLDKQWQSPLRFRRTIKIFFREVFDGVDIVDGWNLKLVAIGKNVKYMFKRSIRTNELYCFLVSLYSFLVMSKAGFRITRANYEGKIDHQLYRFFWKRFMVLDMSDVTHIDGRWSTRMNGKVRTLGVKDHYTTSDKTY